MAPNNPHLKSHRRRNGELAAADPEKEKFALEAKYPGREARPGMEHCKQLSDVLYSRWTDGLRLRWPAV
ncbi:serine/threonine-protein kinase [Verticillium alfalfae VaMs.102]|uniref:Serine/threonine-protein kinase n=1 Tax=Verticillium alfalfae (strain VaMs.102 / ATCC MYA-4576 / FGSC 10136) TaxID=526221 RepID=C9S8W4_VERA1|nr:serine/threonine-protein kinase [Verticillium alfalfae VaMs.102]EEY14041.1 serine/threonine-protein kinase [Verticillium alfalfae VaMs.102]